jgi:hypothetical protein
MCEIKKKKKIHIISYKLINSHIYILIQSNGEI